VFIALLTSVCACPASGGHQGKPEGGATPKLLMATRSSAHTAIVDPRTRFMIGIACMTDAADDTFAHRLPVRTIDHLFVHDASPGLRRTLIFLRKQELRRTTS
jgi:hypothetical protein